jgi:hypothetical protein
MFACGSAAQEPALPSPVPMKDSASRSMAGAGTISVLLGIVAAVPFWLGRPFTAAEVNVAARLNVLIVRTAPNTVRRIVNNVMMRMRKCSSVVRCVAIHIRHYLLLVAQAMRASCSGLLSHSLVDLAAPTATVRRCADVSGPGGPSGSAKKGGTWIVEIAARRQRGSH